MPVSLFLCVYHDIVFLTDGRSCLRKGLTFAGTRYGAEVALYHAPYGIAVKAHDFPNMVRDWHRDQGIC